jgi:hypothetical protein
VNQAENTRKEEKTQDQLSHGLMPHTAHAAAAEVCIISVSHPKVLSCCLQNSIVSTALVSMS